jgi:hypothetical protein
MSSPRKSSKKRIEKPRGVGRSRVREAARFANELLSEARVAAENAKAETTGDVLDKLAQGGPGYLGYAGAPEGVVNFEDGRRETATEAAARHLFRPSWPQFTEAGIVTVISKIEVIAELFPEVVASASFPANTVDTLNAAAKMLRDLAGAVWTIETDAKKRKDQKIEDMLAEAWRQGDDRVRNAIVETENRMRDNCEQLIAAAKKELRRGKRTRK